MATLSCRRIELLGDRRIELLGDRRIELLGDRRIELLGDFMVSIFELLLILKRPSDHRFETELIKSPESYGNSELP